jgi:hypothetical protein
MPKEYNTAKEKKYTYERKGKANANIYDQRRSRTVHERPTGKLPDG